MEATQNVHLHKNGGGWIEQNTIRVVERQKGVAITPLLPHKIDAGALPGADSVDAAKLILWVDVRGEETPEGETKARKKQNQIPRASALGMTAL